MNHDAFNGHDSYKLNYNENVSISYNDLYTFRKATIKSDKVVFSIEILYVFNGHNKKLFTTTKKKVKKIPFNRWPEH